MSRQRSNQLSYAPISFSAPEDADETGGAMIPKPRDIQQSAQPGKNARQVRPAI